MATAKDVIELARSYVGVHEDPLGSNNVFCNTDYYGHPVSGEWYPWCCTFVWDIFRIAGASDLFFNGQRTAYCSTVAAWGAQYEVPYGSAQYGDIVLFDWDGDGVADHIGYVIGLNNDGSLWTVEGNTSDADHSNGGYVLERTRYRGSVYMIIRVQYDDEGDEYMFDVKEVKWGSSGKDVDLAQRLLRGGGYIDPQTRRLPAVDASFGDETERCVKYFQKKNHLEQTGIVDVDKTWPKLLRR